jgi:hypothetical protein
MQEKFGGIFAEKCTSVTFNIQTIVLLELYSQKNFRIKFYNNYFKIERKNNDRKYRNFQVEQSMVVVLIGNW